MRIPASLSNLPSVFEDNISADLPDRGWQEAFWFGDYDGHSSLYL